MRYLLAFVACVVILHENLPAQTDIAGKFVYRSHTLNGTTLPYRLFIPDGYTNARRYPVVLALHGAGERGADNVIQITYSQMATCWADPVNQALNPCFVVAPQCPSNGTWNSDPSLPMRPELAAANDILDSLSREFSIDVNRFYVTGLSMGGQATWEIIMRFPWRFAAAVPMSGYGNPAYASWCAGVPIWVFHGAADNTAPVQYSRAMINALRALGRPVVYTHCHNLDCSGLPDSTIAMEVRSHADLFYTEDQNAGHTSEFWNKYYYYPFLASWVFDKYRTQPGAIELTNLKSYTTLSGNSPITWGSSGGDSVEIWFSSDAGTSWRATANVLNTGMYAWNTSLAPDCAFGSVQVFLKGADGFIFGNDRSAYFAVNNTQNGAPFVRLLNEEFTTGGVFAQDSLDLSILAGDPGGGSLAASLLYSGDGGSTFSQFDSFTAPSSPGAQARRAGIGSLPNSTRMVIGLTVSNGKSASRATTFPFAKATPRLAGGAATHVAGEGQATVTIHIQVPTALTGHRYQVGFDDTSSVQKQYSVWDLDRRSSVVQHASELDGVREGPLFDGIRLVIADLAVPYVNTDSTRWIKGAATLHAKVFQPIRIIGSHTDTGRADPYDYQITLSSVVVDTSIPGFGMIAAPIKFNVRNMTKNRIASVAYNDAHGDSTIGPQDEVDILEPDETGNLRLSWALRFIALAGDILPGPGDVFRLQTVKPVSSSDVYQFTGVVSSVTEIRAAPAFSLEQNYPNPFNPVTTIRYSLASTVPVQLTVYDILGKRVAVVLNERQEAGEHRVTFNGRGLASGVYFYRLQAGSFVQTKKFLLQH